VNEENQVREDGARVSSLDPISMENLSQAFRDLRQHRSASNDEVTYARYQNEAEKNILELSRRLARGEYEPQPLRTVATTSGHQKPISFEALEDRIVQRSVAKFLMASYRRQFLACSYGLSSTQSQEDALRHMAGVLRSHPVTWILPLRVESYRSDTVRQVLIQDLKERFGDKRVLDLMTRWINIGVLEVGRVLKNEVKAVTGQPVLTVLGYIYFHLALDIWFEKMAKTQLKGSSQEIRFVGETILCFEEKRDADEVVDVLGKHLSEFGLILDKKKAHLIECRGDAAELFCFLGSWFPPARQEGDGPAFHEEASSSPEPSIPGQGEAILPSNRPRDLSRDHQVASQPALPVVIEKVEASASESVCECSDVGASAPNDARETPTTRDSYTVHASESTSMHGSGRAAIPSDPIVPSASDPPIIAPYPLCEVNFPASARSRIDPGLLSRSDPLGL
jgi:hypothetical protein